METDGIARKVYTPEEFVGLANGSRQGAPYDPDAIKYGAWTSIEVLSFLKDKPWDKVALAYVHAVRPSHIRVLTLGGCAQLDAQTWRVTVYVDGENKIKKITQEVEVAPPESTCGHALSLALAHGWDSPQAQWARLDGDLMCGVGGTFKITPDGKKIPYPS